MREGSRLVVLICVLVLFGFLASCTYWSGSNTNQYKDPWERFYTGTLGINAQYHGIKPVAYYYGPGDIGNTIDFGVDMHNMGASFSRGGVYVSGYDPNLIQMSVLDPILGRYQEIYITKSQLGACGISIGSIGFGEFGGIFRCDGVTAEVGPHTQGFSIQSISTLAKRFGKTWFSDQNFDLGIDFDRQANVGSNFIVNFNRNGAHMDYYQHGRLFIALLSGLDFSKHGGQEFMLAGRSPDFPDGEYLYLDYKGYIKDWPPGADSLRQNLQITTCYQYTTFAAPIICVDPDPESDNRKVCYPKSYTWSGGNGGPVVVSSVEQENSPRQITFRINIRNSGIGTVYDPGMLEKCSPYYPERVTPADLNIVYLGDVRIGTTGLAGRGTAGGMRCSPDVIRLDPLTKTGTTTCTYPIEYTQIKSAYQTPLIVELWYGYSEAVQSSVLLRRMT